MTYEQCPTCNNYTKLCPKCQSHMESFTGSYGSKFYKCPICKHEE